MRRSPFQTTLFRSITLLVCALAAEGELVVTRYAGRRAGWGRDDGVASSAFFQFPRAIAIDEQGRVFVADSANHVIRAVSPDGRVSTVAGLAGESGHADGYGSDARFNLPTGIAVGVDGTLYIADLLNHAIRLISPSGRVSTLAGTPGVAGEVDGPAATARFNAPRALAVAPTGEVFVVDLFGHVLRKIDKGMVTTIAGAPNSRGNADGTGRSARFTQPAAVVLAKGGDLYVGESYGGLTVRRVGLTGHVTTVAGKANESGFADGTGAEARFGDIQGLFLDQDGSLLVADTVNHAIRRILSDGRVITLIGGPHDQETPRDGDAESARFIYPFAMARAADGALWIVDQGSSSIRRVDPVTDSVSTVAGAAGGFLDGPRREARFAFPYGVAFDSQDRLFVADTYNHVIRRVGTDGVVSTFAGIPGVPGSADGAGTQASFDTPGGGVAVDAQDNVYVSDYGNHTIRRITPAGVVTTLAGRADQPGHADGVASEARFRGPEEIATDLVGNVYVADKLNHVIRRITPAGVVSTIAGTPGVAGSGDGAAATAQFRFPAGVAVAASGDVYVADTQNCTIRLIAGGSVTTLAGQAQSCGFADGIGKAARFSNPWGVAVDPSGDLIVADLNNHVLRRVTPAGAVTTIAGSPLRRGNEEGPALEARLSQPAQVAIDSRGRWFVADSGSHGVLLVQEASVADRAWIDSGTGVPHATRQLAAVPSSAMAWRWSMVRTPWPSSASLSSVDGPSTPFIPDVQGRFEFTLEATALDGQMSVTSRVALDARCEPAPAPDIAVLAGTTALCRGTSVTLEAPPGFDGYDWSTGEHTRTITVSPESSTSVFLVVYASGCSSAEAVVDLTVHAPLSSATISTTGSTRTCGSAPAGTIRLQVRDGGPTAVVWKYRAVQSALPNVLPATGDSYTIDPAHFPSPGRYVVFVEGRPECGLALTSNEIAVEIGECSAPTGYDVRRVAGSPSGPGYRDADGVGARFDLPQGIAVDDSGNVWVADTYNLAIRRISPSGAVSTFVGRRGGAYWIDGSAVEARISYPTGIALDRDGALIVSNYNTIRRVERDGTTSTIAGYGLASGSKDGSALDARFEGVSDVGVHGAAIYIADANSNTVRMLRDGRVTTLAGKAGVSGSSDGRGSAARFNVPAAVAVDRGGNVFVADAYNHTIRKIDPNGNVTTVAGLAGQVGIMDGQGGAARFENPIDLAVHPDGSLLICDVGSQSRIRRLDPSGHVTTVSGGNHGYADGEAAEARFTWPTAIAVDRFGAAFIADGDNGVIRRLSDGLVTTLAGGAATSGFRDGIGLTARFENPRVMTFGRSGALYVVDAARTVRRMLGNLVETMAGDPKRYTVADGPLAAAGFSWIGAIASDADENLYVSDANSIRKIDFRSSPPEVRTIAGSAYSEGANDGPGDAARFRYPAGLAVGASGEVFVADSSNHTIRRIGGDGRVVTIAGAAGQSGKRNGTGSEVRLNWPSDLVFDATGNLLINDSGNYVIRSMSPDGRVTTWADLTGTFRWTSFRGMTLGPDGALYFTDTGNRSVVRVTKSGKQVVLAGEMTHASSIDGPRGEATFGNPEGIAIDAAGRIFVSDTLYHSIRLLEPSTISDEAQVDLATGRAGEPRVLRASPAAADRWEWRVNVRPAGSIARLESTTRQTMFIPDKPGYYEIDLTAFVGDSAHISRVTFVATPRPPRRAAVRH